MTIYNFFYSNTCIYMLHVCVDVEIGDWPGYGRDWLAGAGGGHREASAEAGLCAVFAVHLAALALHLRLLGPLRPFKEPKVAPHVCHMPFFLAFFLALKSRLRAV